MRYVVDETSLTGMLHRTPHSFVLFPPDKRYIDQLGKSMKCRHEFRTIAGVFSGVQLSL